MLRSLTRAPAHPTHSILTLAYTGQVQETEQLTVHPFRPPPPTLHWPPFDFKSERELASNPELEREPALEKKPVIMDVQLELSLEIFVVDSNDMSFPGRRAHTLKREDLAFVSADSRLLECRLLLH